MNVSYAAQLWRRFRKPALAFAALAAGLILVIGVWSAVGNYGEQKAAFIYYTVAKSDLPIVVTERGSLEAQVETTIRCEVESLSRDAAGNFGTQIIFIVPNGSAVKKGDLLVELESSAIRDRIDAQVLDVQRAESSRIQAVSKWENQQLANKTSLEEAKLKVQLAELELQMYEDEDAGTYKLARDDLFRDILEQQVSLALARTEEDGNQQLFNLGYRGKGQLDQARFNRIKAQNNLDSFKSKQKKLDVYERQMQLLTLRGAVESAKRAEEQVENDNKAKMAQVEAAKIEAESVETKQNERLENLKKQLENCKIFAPHDGMVVYAREGRGGSTEIGEGVMVYQRQRLLTLPDLSRMQVKTEIHEAVLDQVRAGLPVTIRVDAFPDKVYSGTVYDVGVVPSSSGMGWFSTGVKTYTTIIRIDGEVQNLKPGMTAVAEIHVDRLKDVLSVPVQAVVQRGRENWCWVDRGGRPEKRVVKLGRSNDKFVHVEEGLAAGDRVVLNPMAILEAQESQGTEISPAQGVSEAPPPVAPANGEAAGDTGAPKTEVRQDETEQPGGMAKPKGMRRGPGMGGPAGPNRGGTGGDMERGEGMGAGGTGRRGGTEGGGMEGRGGMQGRGMGRAGGGGSPRMP